MTGQPAAERAKREIRPRAPIISRRFRDGRVV